MPPPNLSARVADLRADQVGEMARRQPEVLVDLRCGRGFAEPIDAESGDTSILSPPTGDTGLDAAGPLPLAEEPRFPEANQLFLQHLKEHGQRVANLAMASAMGNGQTREGG